MVGGEHPVLQPADHDHEDVRRDREGDGGGQPAHRHRPPAQRARRRVPVQRDQAEDRADHPAVEGEADQEARHRGAQRVVVGRQQGDDGGHQPEAQEEPEHDDERQAEDDVAPRPRAELPARIRTRGWCLDAGAAHA